MTKKVTDKSFDRIIIVCDDDGLRPWTKIFIGIVIACVLFESILIIIAYFNADTVKCNLLYCEFTTIRSSSESTHISNMICYENNIQTNCSDITDWNDAMTVTVNN